MNWKDTIRKDEMRAFADDSDRMEMEGASQRYFDESSENDGDF